MQVLVRTWSNLEVSKTVQAVEITELARGEAIALYQAWIVTNVRLGVCFVDGISSTGSYFIRVGRVSKWTAVDDRSQVTFWRLEEKSLGAHSELFFITVWGQGYQICIHECVHVSICIQCACT